MDLNIQSDGPTRIKPEKCRILNVVSSGKWKSNMQPTWVNPKKTKFL